MKRIIKTTLLLLVVCFTVAGCGAFVNKVETEFNVENLQRIEVFHYITPDKPEKKVVTSKEDMDEVLHVVKDLNVTSSASKIEIPDDTNTTIFRFVLTDDSLCTVIYNNVKGNLGILSTSSEEHHFVKGKKILDIWDNIDCAIEEIPVEDIPILK